ncbi:MAG: hypothetical protein ACREH8_14230 [Opitutaceae bacterium]
MKYLVSFLLPIVASVAQEFAPESIANHLANFNVTGAPGGTASFSHLFTANQSFRLSNTGAPLGDAMTYTWEKTGANTATVVEVDGTRTNTTALTFTAPRTGTFRTTSSTTTSALVGTMAFSSIPQPGPPLINISTRATLAANQVLTPGFVVGGNVPRRVLVRAVGPTLGTAFAVPGSMADPSLTLFSGQTQIAANNDWGGGGPLSAVFSSVGAFVLPVASLDAAVVMPLAPGSYTAQVRGTGAGEVLVEVYFVD